MCIRATAPPPSSPETSAYSRSICSPRRTTPSRRNPPTSPSRSPMAVATHATSTAWQMLCPALSPHPAPTSPYTSPGRIRMRAIGWAGLGSRRTDWKSATAPYWAGSSSRECPWRSRWRADTGGTCRTRSTSISRPSCRPRISAREQACAFDPFELLLDTPRLRPERHNEPLSGERDLGHDTAQHIRGPPGRLVAIPGTAQPHTEHVQRHVGEMADLLLHEIGLRDFREAHEVLGDAPCLLGPEPMRGEGIGAADSLALDLGQRQLVPVRPGPPPLPLGLLVSALPLVVGDQQLVRRLPAGGMPFHGEPHEREPRVVVPIEQQSAQGEIREGVLRRRTEQVAQQRLRRLFPAQFERELTAFPLQRCIEWPGNSPPLELFQPGGLAHRLFVPRAPCRAHRRAPPCIEHMRQPLRALAEEPLRSR